MTTELERKLLCKLNIQFTREYLGETVYWPHLSLAGGGSANGTTFDYSLVENFNRAHVDSNVLYFPNPIGKEIIVAWSDHGTDHSNYRFERITFTFPKGWGQSPEERLITVIRFMEAHSRHDYENVVLYFDELEV